MVDISWLPVRRCRATRSGSHLLVIDRVGESCVGWPRPATDAGHGNPPRAFRSQIGVRRWPKRWSRPASTVIFTAGRASAAARPAGIKSPASRSTFEESPCGQRGLRSAEAVVRRFGLACRRVMIGRAMLAGLGCSRGPRRRARLPRPGFDNRRAGQCFWTIMTRLWSNSASARDGADAKIACCYAQGCPGARRFATTWRRCQRRSASGAWCVPASPVRLANGDHSGTDS